MTAFASAVGFFSLSPPVGRRFGFQKGLLAKTHKHTGRAYSHTVFFESNGK